MSTTAKNITDKAKKAAEKAKTAADRAKTDMGVSLIKVANGIKNSPAKLLMAGLGLLAGIFAVKETINLFKTTEAGQLNHDIKHSQLSYPISYYNQFADTIEEATNTSGTNEKAIYRVFEKMNTNDDVLQLTKSYGKRLNFYFGVPLGSFSLSQILVSELSSSELAHVNKILFDKGINIQF